MNITHVIPGVRTAPFYTAAPAEKGISFSALFRQALEQAAGADLADRVSGIKAVAGGDTDIHSAVIDAQKAEIALNLTIQIRNKAVEAYQEIMRMQI